MDILKHLQTRLNINDENLPEYQTILEEVKKRLTKNDIQFNENSSIAFFAHVINYVRRLKNHEYIDIECDEIRKEIDQDIYKLAEEIVIMISSQYDSRFEEPEVLLIAIHLQTTRVKRKK
ncbi:MAG: PRD domain-containing protein [Chloroflexota bacterium]|nr:PRD domain-containing protein [Chloroflexota bacterium]